MVHLLSSEAAEQNILTGAGRYERVSILRISSRGQTVDRKPDGKGFNSPTTIQARAIPAILKQRDILGGAQTGTEKTAAFALPLLQLLKRRDAADPRPRALVLSPTRELAAQVHENFVRFGDHLPLRSQVIYGGVGSRPQKEKLERGIDVLVACPGRLLDLAGSRHLALSRVEILVLDEADRMLDMGFIHDIRRILKLLPQKRQNILFSATTSNEVRKLARTVLHNPQTIDVSGGNTTVNTVHHVVHRVSGKQKSSRFSPRLKKRSGDEYR